MRSEVEQVVRELADALTAEEAARTPPANLALSSAQGSGYGTPGYATAPPDRPARPPVYTRWWFWTAAGLMVAGAAVEVMVIRAGRD